MASHILVYLLFVAAMSVVADCNSEGDALNAWRTQLLDPNNVLQRPLVPELGQLANLRYLEVSDNNLSGSIPTAIGNLTSLVSLDLQHNQFGGVIPSSIGNLISLSFLYLNSGTIPSNLFQLIQRGNLIVMNVSDNMFSGTVHRTNLTVTTIIQDPRAS
ncbi:hypothetical protein F3Y22_tig00110474pilonHSYRG00058 [Hibiscus syriacus]|uniref:Disease resistance R13L4/SHOC-2-like LRR domain-containing protein n=1 Tax=Hibiscus syriacus TaxID=106335 RepID=A0A6A3AJX4_HIBSY|nr:hypothetical protein F3Y22_tig00110474pilonHSYRG00058 [Hibiscus syriacus]